MYKRLILLIFIILFTNSCSMMGVLIGKLDYYVAKKTSSRLNLYVKQEDKLHIDVEKLFDQIKPEAQVFKSLFETIPKKDKNISQEFIATFIDEFKRPLGSVLQKSSTILSYYLSVLTEKQQLLFIKDLNKKNLKAKKALKKNTYFEQVTDRFEMLLGTLTPKQKLILKKYRYTYKRWQERRYKINERFQKELEEAFKIKDEKVKRSKIEQICKSSSNQLIKILEGVIFDEMIKSYFLVIKEANKDQRETLEKKVEFINGIVTNFINNKYSN